MATLDETLHNVRMIIAGNRLPASIDPAGTAADVAEVFESTNKRVQKALALFKNGQQREAVELIERNPDLFDTIRGLGNPVLAKWPAFCEANDWPTPEHLDDVALSELNKNYAEALNTDTLITKYQTAARSKDYVMCIQYLRAIRRGAKGDDREWSALVRKFETIRLEAIAGQIDAAVQAHDLGALEVLKHELSEEWLEQKERNRCLAAVKDAIAAEHTQRDTAAARRVVEQLEQAYGAKELGETARRLEEFDAIHARGYLNPTAKIQEITEDARAWRDRKLAEQRAEEQFNAAYENLVGMLRRPDPPAREFLKSWDHLRQFHRPLPEEVGRRAKMTAEQIQRRLKTRKMIQVSLAAVAVLLLIGGALLGWQRVQYNRRVEQCVAALLRPLEAGELSVAMDTVAAIRDTLPAVATDPRVTAVMDEIDALQNHVNAELAALDEQLAGMRHTLDELSTEPRSLVSQKSRIGPLLANLESNAVWRYAGDDRRLVLRECKADWDNHQRAMQIALDSPVQEALRLVASDFLGLGPLPDSIADAQDERERLGDWEAQLGGLELTGVSENIQNDAQTLKDRLEQRRDTVADKVQRMQDLDRATNLTSYIELAEEFADTYPESHRNREIDALLQQRDTFKTFGRFRGRDRYAGGEAYLAALEEDGYWHSLHEMQHRLVTALEAEYGRIMERLTNFDGMDALTNLWNLPRLQRRIQTVDAFGVQGDDRLSEPMAAMAILSDQFADFWEQQKETPGPGRQALRNVRIYVPADHPQCEEIRQELGGEGFGGRIFQGNEFVEQDILIQWTADIRPSRMPHCTFFQGFFRYVHRVAEQGSAEHLVPTLYTIIGRVANAPSVPRYLKGKLVDSYCRDLMDLLPPSYLPSSLADIAMSLEEMDFDYPWISRVGVRDETYHSIHRRFAQHEFEPDTWTRHYRTRRASADAMLACGVRPAGVVALFSEEPTAHFFAGVPHDIWVISRNPSGHVTVKVVYEKDADGGDADVSFAARLMPGTPLFSPNINIPFRDYVREFFTERQLGVAELDSIAVAAGDFWPRGYPSFAAESDELTGVPGAFPGDDAYVLGIFQSPGEPTRQHVKHGSGMNR